MNITPRLFEASLECPTQCWLRAAGEQATGNSYAEWVQTQTDSYRAAATQGLLSDTPQGECAIAPPPENLKAAKWRLAVDVVARASSPASSGSVSLPGRTPGETPGQPADGTSAPPPQAAPGLLESRLHALERVPSTGRGRPAQFIPIRFVRLPAGRPSADQTAPAWARNRLQALPAAATARHIGGNYFQATVRLDRRDACPTFTRSA